MADLFSTHAPGLEAPAQKGFSITPDDSNDLSLSTRAIYTGKGGTLVCTLLDDTSDTTFTTLPAGMILPIRVKRVKATGTTASMDLVGLA